MLAELRLQLKYEIIILFCIIVFVSITAYQVYVATNRAGIFEGVLKFEGKVTDYHYDMAKTNTVVVFENEESWNPFTWSVSHAIRISGIYKFDIGSRYLIITENDWGQKYAEDVLSIEKVG
jgi:hypothetical protein